MLLAKHRYEEAERLLTPTWRASKNKPRDEQYLMALYQLNDQMGRIHQGVKRFAQAKEDYESAIALLKDGYAYSPYLAVTRARYGQCLLMLGHLGKAREQMLLSERAFAVQGEVSGYFKRPLQELKSMLAEAS